MLSFVYDPQLMTTEEAADIAGVLDIGHLVSRPFAGGWHVERETWRGTDILNPPVTRADIDALPDPGEHPTTAARRKQREAQGVFADLEDDTIDVAALRDNLRNLLAFLDVAAPTNTQAVAAEKLIIRVELDIIRYLLQRARS